MFILTPFIVLIERRRLSRAIVAWLTAFSLLFSSFGMTPLQAAPVGHKQHGKVARDLDDEVNRGGSPRAKWARK